MSPIIILLVFGGLIYSLGLWITMFVAIAFVARKIWTMGGPKTGVPTDFHEEKFWGSGEQTATDQSIHPFKISVEESVLDDLKDRLRKTRLQDSFDGTNFDYGFRADILRKVIDYWLNVYDWRKVEKELNELKHFKTKIEGIDIHFVHVKKDGTKKTPLMMVHGWPGSFVEFLKIIPLLQNEYELIIPSLPGYGFSEGAHKPGMNAPHAARIFRTLMKRLGHERFLYHGGDWGAVVGRALAVSYPNSVIGYHTTMAGAPPNPKNIIRMLIAEFGFPHWVYETPADYKKWNPILPDIFAMLRESGYMHIQATKPDTVGVALNNDPAGLAAYIMEKFSTWTRKENLQKQDGGLFDGCPYSMDDLLTNVMMYWINGNITSSVRFYKETFSKGGSLEGYAVTVPSGVICASNEVRPTPRNFLRDFFWDLKSYTDCEGGHFLAFENPGFVAKDIQWFVSRIDRK